MFFKKTKITFLITIIFLSPLQIGFCNDDIIPTMIELNPKIEYNKVIEENIGDIELNIKDDEKVKLNNNSQAASLDGILKLSPEEEQFKQALEIQKGKEVEDIKLLWEATLERNPVIRFALEKITTPPQKRGGASSLMAKSIAKMIQGAAILPGLFSLGSASEYPSAIGGQLLSQAFAKRFIPPNAPPSITEPELIQLTGIIENLQGEIISDYYNYKTSLHSLIEQEKNAKLQENKYIQAIKSKDKSAIAVASALCDKAKFAEIEAKQNAKDARVRLERLAGVEAVSNLDLAISENLINAGNTLNKPASDVTEHKSTENIMVNDKSLNNAPKHINTTKILPDNVINKSDTTHHKPLSSVKVQDKKNEVKK